VLQPVALGGALDRVLPLLGDARVRGLAPLRGAGGGRARGPALALGRRALRVRALRGLPAPVAAACSRSSAALRSSCACSRSSAAVRRSFASRRSSSAPSAAPATSRAAASARPSSASDCLPRPASFNAASTGMRTALT
jgi:hypothetical protein